MELLFSSLPAHGHTYPLLPLAIAARAQGHHVTYAIAESFHPVLTALGFDVVAAGPEMMAAFAEAAGRPLDAGPIKPHELGEDELHQVASRAFTEIMPRGFARDLKPILAETKPDLVVYEVANPGAAIAAKAVGVPALAHGFGRAGFAGDDDDDSLRDWGKGLVAIAAEHGVSLDADRIFEFGDPYVDIYPSSIQHPDHRDTENRVPLRPVPFAEPGELPEWVTEHREPLIYLTLGTAFGQAEVLRTAIAGLAATGARVLVAAGPTVDIAALGEVPPSVTVESWVPQADLLPHLDLIVHHGGSGTTLGALGAGVPQLFLPQGADQFINADAVVGAGAGKKLLAGEITGESVSTAAKALLSDSATAAAVRALAEEIAAMPTPDEVAKRLPEFAG
ncbi:glycosyltransferase [Actinokineospora iranica]|uniref:glycosyltransferase n=1 Tax=Actinokineospora iranica TaxID=1271860 RepID=UPI000B83CBF0|nr:glycosyltransferase [Actinokineospora iranica]